MVRPWSGLLCLLVAVPAACACATMSSRTSLSEADRHELAAELARSPELARAVAAEVARSPELQRAVVIAVTAAMPVPIPRAASGEEVTTTLSLTLTRDGSLWLDGRRVTEPEILAAVASAVRAGRPTRAVVASDREVPQARVVRMVDSLRAAGVIEVAVNYGVE